MKIFQESSPVKQYDEDDGDDDDDDDDDVDDDDDYDESGGEDEEEEGWSEDEHEEEEEEQGSKESEEAASDTSSDAPKPTPSSGELAAEATVDPWVAVMAQVLTSDDKITRGRKTSADDPSADGDQRDE